MAPKCLKNYIDEEKARKYRNHQRKLNYDRGSGSHEVSGAKWSKQDEDQVLEHSISDRELSKLIGRSVRAIQQKRCKLKKLNERLDNDKEVRQESNCD